MFQVVQEGTCSRLYRRVCVPGCKGGYVFQVVKEGTCSRLYRRVRVPRYTGHCTLFDRKNK